MNNIKDVLNNLPAGLTEQARADAVKYQQASLQMLADIAKGEFVYRQHNIQVVAQVVPWLNQHKDKELVTVLPDFTTQTYVIIYKERGQ